MSVATQPEDIENFVSGLQRFTYDMIAQASQLQGQFVGLGNTWRDPQFAKFADEVVTTMHMLDNFARSAEEHVPYLRQHA